MSIQRSDTAVVVSIVLVGVAIRIATATAPGSMWFDELHTALNVSGRAWTEVLAPLDYHQVAPVGFIAAEMASVALFGATEGALRLFPLAASIASLVLFWRVASRFLSHVPLYGALALFAVSPALVWYARKVKQYAGDVCAVLVLLLLAMRFLEGRYDVRRAAAAGVVGGVAILFSQPAAIVAAGLMLVLFIQKRRAGEPLLPSVILGALWATGAAFQAITALRLAPRGTLDFMSDAWRFAFIPAPWSSPTAILWLPKRLFHFVGFLVGLMQPDSPSEVGFLAVYAVLAVLGIFVLVRSKGGAAALLLTPLAVAILGSALRVLPLSGRLMIYVAPTFVVACFAGVEWLRTRLPRRFGNVIAIAIVAIPAAFLPLLIPTLNRREDAGRVLRELHERWQPADALFVYDEAVLAMQFYGAPLGLEPWIAGKDYGPDARATLHELDALRGRPRAWFFYTHVVGCKAATIRDYLETIGTEIDRIEDPHGVRGMHETSARLYDLSDPARLPRSSSATHPLLARGDPRCRDPYVPTGGVIRAGLRELFEPITTILNFRS